MNKTNNQKGASFVKQAAILAAAGIIVRIIGFIYKLPLTYMIREEGMGIYQMGYSIYNFFLVLSSAGLPVAISVLVSERIALGEYKAAHRIFKVSLITAGILGLICSLALFFGAGFFAGLIKTPRSYYTLVSLSPTIFIVAIMAVLRGYFQGQNNIVPTAVSQILEQVFNAVFSLLLAYLFMKTAGGLLPADSDVSAVAIGLRNGALAGLGKPYTDPAAMGAAGGTAGTGVGAIAGLAIMLLIYKMAAPSVKKKMASDKTKSKPVSNRRIAFKLICTAVPIIAGTAIFSISGLIDLAMIKERLTAFGHYTPEQADMLYGQLSAKYTTLTTLPISISSSLAVAAIPSISASHALKKREATNEKINSAVRIAMLISIPAAVGMGVLAQPIINLLYPGQPGGKMLLQVGSVSIVFLALAQIVTGMLQGIGKVHIPVIGAACGALAKIPVNYLLVANPQINVMGAVISTTVCYIIASGIDWFFLLRYTRAKPDMKSIFVKPLLASAIMGAACYVLYYFLYYLVGSNVIAVLVAIGISVLIYCIAMLMMNGFKEEDIVRLPMGNKIFDYLKQHRLM